MATPWLDNLGEPRFFEILENTLYLPERTTGKVYVVDLNTQKKTLLLQGLDDPTSVAVDSAHQKLYIGEQGALSEYDLRTGKYRKLLTLPRGGRHRTRTVVLDYPHIFISVGSSCNSCIEQDPLRATILQYDIPSGKYRIYAKGLRNAVGLAVYNHQLYATVNQRDELGDNFPPDTLVYVPPFSDFGWPYCNVNKPDPSLGNPASCSGVPPPIYLFTAHSAPLGIDFSPDGKFIVIALHGSWNRSTPSGHQVLLLTLENGKVAREQTVGYFDRPVGARFWNNTIFISDDSKGTISWIPVRKLAQ